MTTITASYDDRLSRVQLQVTNLTAEANAFRVQRSVDQITWTTVRGAAHVPSGAPAVDDYEFAANKLNYYRAVPLLFEDFLAGNALNSSGTWDRDSTKSHSGNYSFGSAPIGSNETSEETITVPSSAESLSLWYAVSSELGWDIFSVVDPNGNSIIERSGRVPFTEFGPVDVSTWPEVTLRYRKDVSFSSWRDAAWVDDVEFMFPPVSTSITPVIDTVWLKVISKPFLNRPVTVTGQSEVTRPSNNGIFDVVGRSYPVAVTSVRGSRRWTMTVMEPTPEQAAAFDYMLAAGEPVFVQVPPDCGLPRSMYAVIGDTVMTRPTVRARRRFFELPLTETAAPDESITGATVTWESVVSSFATWQDLINVEATWSSVLARISEPEVVIVP